MLSNRFLRLAALAGLMFSAALSSAHATVPTDPAGRCAVIHTYEGVCGNARTEGCFRKTGFNYSNPSHQSAWDNFYNLCVGQSPYKDRYSHECIEHLGLGSSCVSTVEPLIEYTIVNQAQYEVAPLRTEPQYQIVNNYQLRVCSMFQSQREKVDAYLEVCGEVSPSACGVDGTVESEYVAYCGDRKPCQCIYDSGCGPACAEPVLPAPPLPPAAPGDGGGGGGGGGGPGDGGGAPPAEAPAPSGAEPGTTGGATDSTFVLGAENKGPAPVGQGEGNAATGARAAGCSLAISPL